MRAQVFRTVNNVHKKAGALNQWLDKHLTNLAPDDLVMVMDADSTLDSKFLENASGYIARGYGACGGVFSGKTGGGFIGMLQRNEYARYARDVKRKKGKTLVLTGTATLFTARCLQSVVKARKSGKIPREKRAEHRPGKHTKYSVYDTEVLTEDNELTFALLHLGYKIIAPAECRLQTEVMETWSDLWRQRHRWKRGAIENNVQYGLTRYTAKYWGLQIWGFLGIVVTAIYLATTIWAAATWQLHFYAIWMVVTIFYALERSITVRERGWKMSLLGACLVVEMILDIFLQAVHCKAFIDAIRRSKKAW
jgi:cellulose synthase/poly-beta-1,6-N-acetylglucosamine synthase-like glycosyltransferase